MTGRLTGCIGGRSYGPGGGRVSGLAGGRANGSTNGWPGGRAAGRHGGVLPVEEMARTAAARAAGTPVGRPAITTAR